MKPTEKRQINIFDTTLRDGEQAPGNSMTISQKVEMAIKLEEMGVNTIEAGFPSASIQDHKAVQEIALNLKKSKVCAFARCNQTDIDRAKSALKLTDNRQIELLGVGSDIHLNDKRKISRDRAIEEVVTSVKYAKTQGFDDIRILPEDATRADPQFLITLLEAGLEAGGTGIVIADTVGYCIPSEFSRWLQQIKKTFSEVPVSVHCHNDLGLALANTLAGIEAGADEVQVTLCGIGERAGNAALEEIAAVLDFKSDYYNCTTNIDLKKLYPAAQKLLSFIGHPPLRTKAVVGENAFATEAGIHQSGILKNPLTYEILNPGKFDRTRKLVLGRHSGRSLIRHKLISLGLQPESALVDRLYEELVANGDSALNDASLDALLAASLN